MRVSLRPVQGPIPWLLYPTVPSFAKAAMFTNGALELLFVEAASTDIPLSDIVGLCEFLDMLRPSRAVWAITGMLGIPWGCPWDKLWKFMSPIAPGTDTGGMLIWWMNSVSWGGGIRVVSGLRTPECRLNPSFSKEECKEDRGLSGTCGRQKWEMLATDHNHY